MSNNIVIGITHFEIKTENTTAIYRNLAIQQSVTYLLSLFMLVSRMMYFYYLKPSLQLPKSKSHINFSLILCANNAQYLTHWFIQHANKFKRFWPMSLALNMSWFVHQMVLNSLLLTKKCDKYRQISGCQ